MDGFPILHAAYAEANLCGSSGTVTGVFVGRNILISIYHVSGNLIVAYATLNIRISTTPFPGVSRCNPSFTYEVKS